MPKLPPVAMDDLSIGSLQDLKSILIEACNNAGWMVAFFGHGFSWFCSIYIAQAKINPQMP